MDTYFVILEFHLQAGFEDAALIVEEADTVGRLRNSSPRNLSMLQMMGN
jgi:hypothetical protein